jgi:putative addiction module antidote
VKVLDRNHERDYILAMAKQTKRTHGGHRNDNAKTAATTSLRRIGNSTGLTFTAEALKAAGLAQGDRVVVSAAPGRVVVSKADDLHARCMAMLERHMQRYDKAFARLAK